MTRALGLIIMLAVGIGFLIAFLIKNVLSPKRAEALGPLIKRGKTQLAIRSARRLLAKDSRNAEAHYFLALALYAEKKEDQAYREFKILNNLSIQGKNIPEIEYRQTMAQLYAARGESEEALKEYLLLVKLMPKKGEYYFWAGKLFGERGKGDTAREYLQKAAELSPRDGKIYYELGVLCYKEKKAPEAKAALERALRLQKDSEQAQTWYYLGKLQKELKEYSAATGSFEKALKNPEYRLRALVERGGCYMSLNDLGKAVPDLEKAVGAITDESSQDSLYARYFLGICYEKNREIDKAVAQWEKVYKAKKGFRDVGERLSQYQELKSDGGGGGSGMSAYVSGGNAEFLELCKSIVTKAMELRVQGAKNISDGCEFIAIEGEAETTQNARKAPRLIRFYRSSDPADEAEIRSILDDAKEQNIPRTAVIAGAGFSQAALEYANSRSVELFGREKLSGLLRKAAR
jgi:tetratricopeptide (TPR) repeat protein